MTETTPSQVMSQTDAGAHHVDKLATALARVAVEVDPALSEEAKLAARRVLMDTFAVSIGALRHPAAQVARRFAYQFPFPDGALVWGTTFTTTPEVATLVNGVPLRGYDYNDLYMGKAAGGHPSDIVPGLIATAEFTNASTRDLLVAIAVAYEVTLHLFDTVPTKSGGWDYPNLTALGAVCGIGRLIGLDRTQTAEALSIVAGYHLASNEVESNELNARGDLTMWKRFNGSNAVRAAVDACLLARSGAEGIVRAFMGREGYAGRIGLTPGSVDALISRLDGIATLTRVTEPTFKRWPVGSRAQSAIQAALEAREKLDAGDEVESVRVVADAGAYSHLVAVRDDPWLPHSRETADHSLPYTVAAAVIDGRITPWSFNLEQVTNPERLAFLKERVTVEENDKERRAEGFPSSVTLTTTSGRVAAGEALPPPGHPLNPFSNDDFEEKLRENVSAVLDPQALNKLVQQVWALEDQASVKEVLLLLVAQQDYPID